MPSASDVTRTGKNPPPMITTAEETLKKGFRMLRFPAPLESAFLDYYQGKTLKRVRMGLIVGISLYAMFGITDMLLFPAVKESAWLIRYAVVCPLALLVLSLTYVKGFKRFIQPALWLAMFVGGLGIIAMIALDREFGGNFYYAGLLLVIMYAFTLIGMRFWYGVTWVATTVLCYEATAMLINHTPFPVLVFNSMCVLSATFIGGFSNYLMEHYIRRDFLRTMQLEHEKIQLEEVGEKLQRLAVLDELTGIANRRCFDNFFDQEWARALRAGTCISLVMFDIDSFKAFNDNYGHQAGDDCLKQVATEIRTFARRPGDLTARYGGEEFVLVLADTDAVCAADIAESIRTSVESLRISHDHSLTGVVTISAGVATVVPDPDISRKWLIEVADLALYQAKRDGKNRVVTWQQFRSATLFVSSPSAS